MWEEGEWRTREGGEREEVKGRTGSAASKFLKTPLGLSLLVVDATDVTSCERRGVVPEISKITAI